MRLSNAFAKATKQVSEDEVSVNAQLLMRAGFIDKTMAGVYTYLPLGLRVLRKISAIVRDEMDAVGGQELLMPALQSKESWEITGRWDGLDVLFKVPSVHGGREYALGPTHEEVVVQLAQKFLHSYRDFPRYVYQIQTKFRDEARAKSGILRGREFLMKDLYSFHVSQEDLKAYYEVMKGAYARVFSRLGLEAIETMASGGTFSDFSHEYQVVTEHGEDIIFVCDCGYAVNQEIAEGLVVGAACPSCKVGFVAEKKAIEVGNIFELNRKYSDPFGLTFTTEDGSSAPVYMGCYGIGISRLMGSIVEVYHDDRGLRWPASVSPGDVHVVQIGGDLVVDQLVKEFLDGCDARGISYVFDDRDISVGAALAEADLIGLPYRVVVSGRSVESGGIELKARDGVNQMVVSVAEALDRIAR